MIKRQTFVIYLTALCAGYIPAAAHEPSHSDYHAAHMAQDTDFREHHPLRVYLQLDNNGGQHPARGMYRKGHKNPVKAGAQIHHQLDYHLPEYIRFVSTPQRADLVLRVNQTGYQMDFRVVDVDHKDKKYKKKRKYAPGKCGVHYRAFYTKVKEKGEAQANYEIHTNLKGLNRDHDRIHVRASETYTYGKNLRAQTNCGMQPTHNMPNADVAELFARSDREYRDHVAYSIKEETLTDLSASLSRHIRRYADTYYHDLAYNLREHKPHKHDRYGLHMLFRILPNG